MSFRYAGWKPALRTLVAGFCLWALVPAHGLAEETAPELAGGPVDRPAVVSEQSVVEPLLGRLESTWWQRYAFLESGDRSAASESTDELLGILADEKVQRLEALAGAAVAEGHRELAARRPTTAVESFRLARRLDPEHAAAFWGEARTQLQHKQWRSGFLLVVSAVRAHWGSYWTRYALLANTAAILWTALVVASLLAIPVLLLKHGPLIVRAIDERLPARWHRSWRVAIGWGILLAPLVLQWLGAWTLLIWAVLLLVAASRRERTLLAAGLIALAATPAVVGALGLLTAVAASPAARVAAAAAERGLEPDQQSELELLVASHPNDAPWRALLARLVASRHPDRAVALMREAVELAPNDPRLRIALGNLLFRVGKLEAAGVHYREARDIDSTSVMALYNLWRVRSETFDFEEGEEALREARRLDVDTLRALEREAGEDDVADPVFEVSEMAGLILREEFDAGLGALFSLGNPVTLAALVALVLGLIGSMRFAPLDAVRCTSCGRAASQKGGELSPDGTCTACSHLFSRREGLAPAAREEQMRRIDRHMMRVKRGRFLAQLLWPGLGLIHDGRTGLGFAASFVWVFFVSGAIFPQMLLPMHASSLLWRPGLCFAVLAVLFWLVAQLPFLRPQRPRPAGRR